MGNETGPAHPSQGRDTAAPDAEGKREDAFVSDGDVYDLVRGEAMAALARGGAGTRQQRRMLLSLQRSAGNAAVARLLRAVAPPRAGSAPAPATLIVEGQPGPGQIAKLDFLDRVHDAVLAVAESELTGTIFSSAGCPWIEHWVAYYRTRSADEVEEALRRYAPAAAAAHTPDEAVAAVCTRIADGIRTWRQTGALPDEASAGAPAAGPAGPPAATPLSRAVLARSPRAVLARSPTAAPPGDDGAHEVLADLGPGRPLNPAERRVAGAFASDLGAVRIHDDGAAAGVTAGLRARAITVGSHVAFAPGRHPPGTVIGDALLAHELAHVVQQQSGASAFRPGTGPSGPETEADLEHDANQTAAGALARLLAGPDVAAAQPRHHRGLAVQRCGSDVFVPPLPAERTYDEVVADLRRVAAHKRAVAEGREVEDPALLATEPDLIAALQRMGIRLSEIEILSRLLDDPTTDLRQVRGRLVQTPGGTIHWGDRVRFQAQLDYVPPGRNVEYEWRLRPAHDQPEYQWGQAPGRGSHDHVDVGEGFWFSEHNGRIGQTRKFEVTVKVYLGKETHEQTTLTTGEISIADEHVPSPLALVAEPAVPIVGGIVRFHVDNWAPDFSVDRLDWVVDGHQLGHDTVGFQHAFSSAGAHSVDLHVDRVQRGVFSDTRQHLTDGHLDLTVQDVSQASTAMLDQMQRGTPTLPETRALEESLEASIREIEHHAAEGGEQRDYWVDRLKTQRERLAALRKYAFDLSTAEQLPTDPAALTAGHTYSGPIPAVLSMPEGAGVQPLTIQISSHQDGGQWVTHLIDMTSKDVFDREGRGSTPLEAHRAAVRAWIADHPYPRHGTVTYRFPAAGWDVPTSFRTKDTAWDTAVAWLDGIVTVGGYLAAGLLLAAPEATVTKWLGYTILVLSVARSGIAIYENLNSGVAITDTRNVIEGLSILTSVLGVGGPQLRAAGIRNVRPAMFRAGNAAMVIGLGTDVGVLVLVASDGLEQLRAVQADPTLDEGQKAAATIRLAGVLGVQSLLMLQSHRELFQRGISVSDFVRTDPRASALVGAHGEIEMTTGSRLDVAVEFRRAGDAAMAEHTVNRTVPDSELLDRHAMLPWLKTLPAADVADLSRRLSTRAMTRLQTISAADALTALRQVGDDALFNQLAITYGGARTRTMAPGIETIRTALGADPQRLAAIGQMPALEATGKVSGFEEWVAQTAPRAQPNPAATPAQRAEQVADIRRLTGELSALQAVAAQEAGNPNTVVRFTPAPPTTPGTPTPRSFDIRVETRPAPGTPGPAAPSRLIEVETMLNPVRVAGDLDGGIAHAASKLQLGTTPGAPTTPAGASAEAAVVIPGWPPPPNTTPAGATTTFNNDGSYTQTFPGGHTRTGNLPDDLINRLNGPLRRDGTRGQSPLDDSGAPFLDRVNVIDGQTGRVVFSLVNDPAAGTTRTARHSWRRP